ncbi:MAG: catechol 2,3-dioxygenase-like lactoylglutathione lyase family enzyme [Ilumatobacter sp.]|jgi:catechol 2,3-dioxygenase-like lactoylglutathione lyase family enzyme
MHIEHSALLVDDYDTAIEFFVGALGFDLIEDSPALTNDGRRKRWVVVGPPGAQTSLLLARADGVDQAAVVGRQFASRVGLLLRVDDFDVAYQRMLDHNVEFVTAPQIEPYGTVAVFRDVAGNKWDLLGPDPRAGATVR